MNSTPNFYLNHCLSCDKLLRTEVEKANCMCNKCMAKIGGGQKTKREDLSHGGLHRLRRNMQRERS